MIIGLSHIGITTDDLSNAISFVSGLGFSLEFVEYNLANDLSKVPFLMEYTPSHDIAFLKSGAGSTGIELIRYSEVFSPAEVRLKAGVKASTGARDEDLDFLLPGLLLSEVSARSSISFIQLSCVSPETGSLFWEKGLGLRRVKENDSSIEMEPSTYFPHFKIRLQLVKCPSKPPNFFWKLDTKGITLISLISTNPEEDARRAEENGARLVSSPFCLTVNQKKLTVVLLYGPEGEIVELIKFSEVSK